MGGRWRHMGFHLCACVVPLELEHGLTQMQVDRMHNCTFGLEMAKSK